MSPRKIAFATGSRADYGIVRRYLEKLNNDPGIDLEILVTGALLDGNFGHQVQLIYDDGFKVGAEIPLPISTASDYGVVHCMAAALEGFGKHFAENKYDLLIILGDRYEMLSVSTAAAMQKIPILHLHGGEATFANYDEFIRHSITKMAQYHFTATEDYRRRVIQLGEQPDRVFYLGALGAENCLYIDETNVPDSVKILPEKKYFVVLFHPETLTNADTVEQTRELLDVLKEENRYSFVCLGSNADTNSHIIRKMIGDFVSENENVFYYENLHTDAYHYLLKNAICLIGNSSSGIIEAPSLGIYTVNIGDRQAGRIRGNSVIDTVCEKNAIGNAMKEVLARYKTVSPENPYYKPDSARLYYETTLKLLDGLTEDMASPKQFFDIK